MYTAGLSVFVYRKSHLAVNSNIFALENMDPFKYSVFSEECSRKTQKDFEFRKTVNNYHVQYTIGR